MHQASSAAKSRHSASSPSRFSKFVAAGAAVVGVGALGVQPVSSAIDEIKAQERAVALTAAADPLAVWQNFIAETQVNLELLNLNASNSQAALSAALEDADLLGELTNIVVANATNPVPLVTRLLSFQEVYGDDIDMVFNGREDDPDTAAVNENYDGVFERLQIAVQEFGPLLQDLATYDPAIDPETGLPTEGKFTNAAFELNNYFVLRALNALRPLSTATPAGYVPLLSIPGDFLGGGIPFPTAANPNPTEGTDGGFETALPGFQVIDNVVNVFGEQGAARALFGPVLTSGFQVAQVLDDTQAALDAGEFEEAVTHLINLPALTTNAFVNGFTPSFSPGEWPSLLSGATNLTGSNTAPGGLQYALVTSVNDLVRALGGTPPPLVEQLPSTTPDARTGNDLLKLTGPAEGSVDVKVEPAPQPSTEKAVTDTTKLVSDTVPAADETGEKAPATTPSTPAGKKATSTWGTKTQDAIKKARTDAQNTVKSIFNRKKESSKAEPSTSAGGAEAGTTGGGTGSTGGGKTEGADKSGSSNNDAQ